MQATPKSPVQTRPTIESKIFYSSAPHLIIEMSHGTVTRDTAGNRYHDGVRQIAFSGRGDEQYGFCITKDPDEIAFLEELIASGRDDIFDGVEFLRRTTPLKVQVDNAERALADAQRTIETKNALIADLVRQGKMTKEAAEALK